MLFFKSSLDLPTKALEHIAAVGIDFGTTLIKVAVCVSPQIGPNITISLAAFALSQEDDVIKYLLEELGPESNRFVYWTGLDNPSFKYRVTSTLGLRSAGHQYEIACTVEALLQLLRTCPRSAVVQPRCERGYEAAQVLQNDIEANKIRLDSVSSSADGGVDLENDVIDRSYRLRRLLGDLNDWDSEVTQPYILEDASVLPCLIASLGSASTFTKVNGDGSYQALEGHSRSGSYIMALGSLLTGIQSFNELIKLAQAGDNRNVSTYIRDMKQTECGEGFKRMPAELLLLSFGKAQNRSLEDFKREDLASAVVSTVVHDITQTAYLTALAHNVNKVFFCGTLANEPFIQEKLTKYFYIRQFFGDKPVEPLFLQNGAYLATLGALFSSQRHS